ncbi:MAG: response regulator, partial [Polyangiaceae bacterium]
EEALAYCDEPDAEVTAVVLDQTMPGMGGQRALVEMRKRFPTLPVVRTSGYAADPAAPVDENTHFLSKPYSVDELIGALKHAIARDDAEA